MRNIKTIIKKELTRFLYDKKLLFTAVFMPGILMYLMYTVMGNFMQASLTVEDDYIYQVAAYGLPESVESMLKGTSVDIQSIEDLSQVDTYIDSVETEELDLVLVFSEEFDASVAEYDIVSGEIAPQVEMFYSSKSAKSSTAYFLLENMFSQYETGLANKFDINAGEKQYDLATNEEVLTNYWAKLLPMLILVLLASACISLAPDAVAGEKERRTINTLLVTPIKRSNLAVGKIVSLSILAIMSGIVSCLGLFLSLPSVMDMTNDGINASMYTLKEYIGLAMVIITTVLVMITITTILSTSAKSVKEANAWAAPFNFIVMAIGCSGLVISPAELAPMMYAIPIFNSTQCFNAILSFNLNITNVLITIGSNLVWVSLLVFVLTKMFNSEKVMLNS